MKYIALHKTVTIHIRPAYFQLIATNLDYDN